MRLKDLLPLIPDKKNIVLSFDDSQEFILGKLETPEDALECEVTSIHSTFKCNLSTHYFYYDSFLKIYLRNNPFKDYIPFPEVK